MQEATWLRIARKSGPRSTMSTANATSPSSRAAAIFGTRISIRPKACTSTTRRLIGSAKEAARGFRCQERMMAKNDLVLISEHEKGFWQADLYKEGCGIQSAEWEIVGPSPDDFF